MGVPYSYFEASFPSMALGEEVRTAAQLAMPWGDETAHTTVRYLGLSPSRNFEHFQVRHQDDMHIDATWHGNPIKRLIRNREFDAFFHRSAGYVLFEVNKKLARSVVERLQTSGEVLPISIGRSPDIDLHVMERLGSRTIGGYFGNLKIEKVKSAALFGVDVDASEEWDHYSEAGDVSALLLEVVAPDEDMRSMVLTRERVVLLHTTTTKSEDLEFVAHVHDLIANWGTDAHE